MSTSSQSSYWETRNAAIRRFYGDVKETDFKKFLVWLWYDPNKDKCYAEEPAHDNAACLSKHTQTAAMYGIQNI